jgi:hypothetical protein
MLTTIKTKELSLTKIFVKKKTAPQKYIQED